VADKADWRPPSRIILSDGFTTRSTATSTSGRGIGMAAVSQAVAGAGGTLSVHSALGAGTCWRAVLPLSSDRLPPSPIGRELAAGNPPAQLWPLGTHV